MDNQGWVKIHRKILDNPAMQKPTYFAVWMYLLLSANHQDNEIVWNNQRMKIKRGQFVGSLRKISEYFGISIATISYILKFFISEQMIEQSSNKRFTLFTIVNYDVYQEQIEQRTEIKVKSKLNQIETNNNDKNVKNEKNNTSKRILTIEEANELKSIESMKKCILKSNLWKQRITRHEYTSMVDSAYEWSNSNQKKKSDWLLTIRTWLRKQNFPIMEDYEAIVVYTDNYQMDIEAVKEYRK